MKHPAKISELSITVSCLLVVLGLGIMEVKTPIQDRTDFANTSNNIQTEQVQVDGNGEILGVADVQELIEQQSVTTSQIKQTVAPTYLPASLTPIPTTTFRIQPVPTLADGVCPERTESCVPCTAGQPYCRYVEGSATGYLGWACQNNNPGNIRYSQARINIITAYGGPPPCGSKGPNSSSQYMVFKDYISGRNALKVYISAISQGTHSSYNPECANGGCSLKFFFSKYASAADQNDPNSYANFVAGYIGVNADTTPLGWIVANKLDGMADAIQIREGWFVL